MIDKNGTDVFEQFLNQFTLEELEKQAESYAAKADEYRRRASTVNQLIRLRKAMGDVQPNGARPPVSPAEETEETRPAETRPSVPAAIRTVMSERPRHDWHVDELMAELEGRGWQPGGKTPRNALDAALSRLTKAGEIERVGTGTYRLLASEEDRRMQTAAVETLLSEGGEG